MRKMFKKMNEQELTNIQAPNFSRMLKDKTVKFELIQQILDYLGYELVIREK